jgi:hypothetical protein
MTGYEWLGAALMYLLALWVVLSGLDDVFVQAVAFWLRLRGGSGIRTPSESDLRKARLKRIAVFVPLWREHRVIRRMLEHNLAAVRYPAWDVFVGVYPNDPETGAAVAEAAALFPNVHLAMCPHPGPTSKADCLNWVYQRMLLLEEERRVRFEAVVIHDAEDLIHPESLRLIAYWLEKYDMVQIPVLPLPTPPREWTHGLYCDEFAQYQSTDIPVRQFLGGFIASNGVGTGFSRAVLEALAGRDGNRIFEPSCLTEDYDAGFRVHALGRPQLFVPIHYAAGGPVATREYFPRSFRAAIRQRTRWVMGIALQGWERHGWRVFHNSSAPSPRGCPALHRPPDRAPAPSLEHPDHTVRPSRAKAFARPLAGGVHAHLRAVVRQAAGVVERIHRPHDELDVALRVDVVQRLPGHLAGVLHVHVLVHHHDALAEHRLAQAPDGVHHLARVPGYDLRMETRIRLWKTPSAGMRCPAPPATAAASAAGRCVRWPCPCSNPPWAAGRRWWWRRSGCGAG